MTREEVERELREKLRSLSVRAATGRPMVIAPPNEVVSTLLPWIMEMREDAAVQARIGDGQLP